MASISFTYNNNYNEDATVNLASQFDETYTNSASSYFFSYSGTQFEFFRGSPVEYGTSFFDLDREVRIDSNYSVNLDLSDNLGSVILAGGQFGDILRGGSANDTLRGLGGADTLDGGAGNDRLVISQAVAGDDGVSGVTVHGGDNVDTLFLQGRNTFKFSINENFDGIEKIYVADGASLDLAGITAGVNIISKSTLSDPEGGSDNVTGGITGTDAADIIKGGKGKDFINGGAGSDKLTAGSGHDTFVFTEGFGRDNVYKFTVDDDHFDVSSLVTRFEDINIKQLNVSDTLITFDGAGSGNKIILHDVVASSLDASDFDFMLR